MNYSPWPDEGKRWRFEWRKAVWALARPWYGANNVIYTLPELTWFSPIAFWFPFVAYRSSKIHFYLGWKPITLDDPAFYWRALFVVDEWRKQDKLFVQLSVRFGFGGIS